jgi:hypothetical protein
MMDDLSYALAVTGGGTFFFIAWWVFVLLVRGGIGGVKALVAFLHSNQKHKVRRLFIGDWR